MDFFAKLAFISTVTVLLFVQHCVQSWAQSDSIDTKTDKEQALVERWYKVYDEIAGSMKFSYSSSGIDPAPRGDSPQLKMQMILKLVATAGMRHGEILLWTDNGRPIIIGAIMSAQDNDVPMARVIAVKFHSLTQGKVAGSRYGQVFWECDEPGVQWKEGLSDITPSSNRLTRLTQMKGIVREFEASGTVGTAKMRLLPQPVYRYPENTPEVTDGAIFAFVAETDPKAFLQIELRQNEWVLACSHNMAFETIIRKDGKVVWKFDRVESQTPIQTKPFYLKFTSERRLKDDPSKVLYSIWGLRQ